MFVKNLPTVSIQGKPIPVELQLGAVTHICRVFGVETEPGCSFQAIKNLFRERFDKYKRLTCIFGPKATAVYIKNLPSSFYQIHVITLMNLFSDFNTIHPNFYVDVFQDSQTRHCLIRFIKDRFLLQVFKDLQALRGLDSKIIVTLDIDNALSHERDLQNPLYNPKIKRNKILRQYIREQQLDVIDDQINYCYINVENEKSTSTDTTSKPVADHTDENDKHITPTIGRLGPTIVIQQKMVPVKTVLGAAAFICKEFGIEMNQARPSSHSQILSLLEDTRKFFRERAVGLKTTVDQDIHPDWMKCNTKAVHIKNLPPSFHQFHVTTLIYLLSDFNMTNLNFFVDMYEDAQHRNTGECLIRFFNKKFVGRIFIDMLALRAFNSAISVRLDIDCNLCQIKDCLNPLYDSRKKVNKSLRKYIMSQKFDYSNCIMSNTGDNLEESEDEDDVIEIEQKHEFIEINDSDDDDDIVEVKGGNVVIEINDKDNDDAVKRNNTADDILEIVDKDDEVVEIKESDDNKMTKCEEKSKSASIDEASIRIQKSVPKTEQQDINSQNTSNIKQKLADKTVDITSNAGKASGESDLLFYEDKTGDFTISNTGKASTRSDENFNEVGVLDDRTIVSLMTFGKTKERTRKRSIIVLLQRINKSLKYDWHTVTKNDKLTGEFLLKFPTAANAMQVYKGLIGAIVKKKPTVVKLLSSQDTAFPKTDKSASSKAVCTTKKSASGVVCTAKRKLISIGDVCTDKTNQIAKRKKANDLRTRNADNFSFTFIPPEECTNDTYGLNIDFLKKHRINLPLRKTVVVKNLQSAVDEEKLYEVFSLAGAIRSVNNIISETEGHTAKIEFDHPVEAVQAISLFHDQNLYDQKISVQMDTALEKQPLPLGLYSVGKGLGKNGEPMRGVRNVIDLTDVKEALVEAGKLIKLPATDRTMPFKYTYIERKLSEIEDNRNNSVKDLNLSNAIASNTASNIGSIESKETDPGSDELDSNLIQELSTVLASRGLISGGANCKDLESIVNVIKSKPHNQTEPMNEKNMTQNYEPLNPNLNIRHPNFVRNPNMPNFIPNQNTQSQVLSQMMLCISNVLRPDMSQNIQFRPNMQGSGRSNFNPNIPNMAVNAPHMNQHVDNPIKQASLLYGNPAPSGWNFEPKIRQLLPNLTNESQQVQKIQKQPKLNNQRYFSRDLPQDSNPLRPCRNSGNTNGQNEDVIYLADPLRRQSQQQPDENWKSSKDRGNKGGENKTDMLIFKNLPPCVSNEALASKLGEVGEVLFCEMTGRGRAVVRYKNPLNAERCMHLFNNSKVEGKIIGVSLVHGS